MRPAILSLATLLVLGACASGPEGNPWYSQGDANYDALKAANDACKEKGGDFQLKPGGEPTHLGDYACLHPKGS
jgi:hypothetical protein